MSNQSKTFKSTLLQCVFKIGHTVVMRLQLSLSVHLYIGTRSGFSKAFYYFFIFFIIVSLIDATRNPHLHNKLNIRDRTVQNNTQTVIEKGNLNDLQEVRFDHSLALESIHWHLNRNISF